MTDNVLNRWCRTGLLVAAVPLVLSAQPTGPDLQEVWVGSGTLTNDWTDASDPKLALKCVYTGKAQPPSITLTLPSTSGDGQLALDMPSPGPSCPPLRKRFQIRATIAGTRVTFTDPAGDRWRLSMTDDLLSGDVLWDVASDSPAEALAVGFTYQPPLRPWDVPLTRMYGKVALRRSRE